MINRHGVQYSFEPIDKNTYKLIGDFGNFIRYGAMDGETKVDFNNLRFVDPSGGPFIGIGSFVDGREVTKISAKGTEVFFKCKKRKEKQ